MRFVFFLLTGFLDQFAGFDDYEIFSRLKEGEEENVEDNVVIQ